eukprot:9395751-Karenia_brevis.AAC.1
MHAHSTNHAYQPRFTSSATTMTMTTMPMTTTTTTTATMMMTMTTATTAMTTLVPPVGRSPLPRQPLLCPACLLSS